MSLGRLRIGAWPGKPPYELARAVSQSHEDNFVGQFVGSQVRIERSIMGNICTVAARVRLGYCRI
jgi:hypothetical protein